MLLLLVLLLVAGTSQAQFFGTVLTFEPKTPEDNGNITVVFRYKMTFQSCSQLPSWDCSTVDCDNVTVVVNTVDVEGSGEWCLQEGSMTVNVTMDAPFMLQLSGSPWVSNVHGIVTYQAAAQVTLMTRSDTGMANRSPLTNILPLLRVPSNCQRQISLLAFDPDGDSVLCRYGTETEDECSPCTHASVLTLASFCNLFFSPTDSSNEGLYAVQLMLLDFPLQTINLTYSDGFSTTRTPSDDISAIPLQFAFQVDPAVPSCTEGLYLPRFLDPTPANNDQLYARANQALQIRVRAEANYSTISELLFSGPYNINLISGTGEFLLEWRPSESQQGEVHPICFVVQATLNSTKYHSEMRCVTVHIANDPTTTTPATTTTHQPEQVVLRAKVRVSSTALLSNEEILALAGQFETLLQAYGIHGSVNVVSVS